MNTTLNHLLILLLLIPNCALGEWKHEIDFGMSVYKGNTDAKNFNGKLHSQYIRTYFQQDLYLAGLLALGKNNFQEQERTAEKYNIKDTLKYNFFRKNYLYGRFEAQRDHFSVFIYEFNESIGIGQEFISTDSIRWNAQAGPGGRHHQIREQKKHFDELMWHAESTFDYKWNSKTNIKELLTITSSSLNTKVRAQSELKTILIDPIAAKITVDIEYLSKLPESSKRHHKTDTTMIFSLSYSF
jgi:putative salt-induced outer membrane protein